MSDTLRDYIALSNRLKNTPVGSPDEAYITARLDELHAKLNDNEKVIVSGRTQYRLTALDLYRDLQRQLDALPEDSAEAEDLRDQMDRAWIALSEDERVVATGVAKYRVAYEIHHNPPPGTSEEALRNLTPTFDLSRAIPLPEPTNDGPNLVDERVVDRVLEMLEKDLPVEED